MHYITLLRFPSSPSLKHEKHRTIMTWTECQGSQDMVIPVQMSHASPQDFFLCARNKSTGLLISFRPYALPSSLLTVTLVGCRHWCPRPCSGSLMIDVHLDCCVGCTGEVSLTHGLPSSSSPPLMHPLPCYTPLLFVVQPPEESTRAYLKVFCTQDSNPDLLQGILGLSFLWPLLPPCRRFCCQHLMVAALSGADPAAWAALLGAHTADPHPALPNQPTHIFHHPLPCLLPKISLTESSEQGGLDIFGLRASPELIVRLICCLLRKTWAEWT